MKRLDDLLLAFEEGQLEESELVELKRLLATSPDAREALVMHGMITRGMSKAAARQRSAMFPQTATNLSSAESTVSRPEAPTQSLPHSRSDRSRDDRTSRRWRIQMWVPMTLAAAAVLLATAWWNFAGERSMPIDAYYTSVGAAFVERDGERLTVIDNLQAHSGDTIIAQDGLRMIYRGEDTHLALDADTRLVLLDDLAGKQYRLEYGRLEATVSKQPAGSPLRVHTEQAITEVVGTRFTLSVESEVSRLLVHAGTVRLTPLGTGAGLLVGAQREAIATSESVRFSGPEEHETQQRNRIRDPGFEGDGSQWHKLSHAGRRIVNTPTYDGHSALQMEADRKFDRGVFQDLAVSAGEQYRITLQARCDGLDPHTLAVWAIWLRESPTTIASRTEHPGFDPNVGTVTTKELGDLALATRTLPSVDGEAEAQWKPVDSTLQAPMGANGLRLYFHLPAQMRKGMAYFDAVSVSATRDQPPAP